MMNDDKHEELLLFRERYDGKDYYASIVPACIVTVHGRSVVAAVSDRELAMQYLYDDAEDNYQ